MSTFRQMDAMEVLYSDRDATTSPGGIRGLKVADMERAFPAWKVSRTRAGYVRKTDSAWDAHAYLDKFKTLASVDNVTDRDDKGLVLRLNFTDGTSEYFDHKCILLIEDPVIVAAKN